MTLYRRPVIKYHALAVSDTVAQPGKTSAKVIEKLPISRGELEEAIFEGLVSAVLGERCAIHLSRLHADHLNNTWITAYTTNEVIKEK
jgi:hypothetical protein